MATCLVDFIRATHRARDVNTPEQIQIATHKLLALHAPRVVPWRNVYRYVASDLDGIEYRTEEAGGINCHTAADITPLLETLSVRPRTATPEIMTHFVAAVQPPAGRELVYFFNQSAPDHVIHAMVASDRARVPRATKRGLYETVVKYARPAHMTQSHVEASIASVITNYIAAPELDADQLEDISMYMWMTPREATVQKAAAAKDPPGVPPATSRVFRFADAGETGAVTEHEFRSNADVRRFKSAAGLTTQFPASKTAIQMVTAALAPEHLHVLEESRMLGRRQRPADVAAMSPVRPTWTCSERGLLAEMMSVRVDPSVAATARDKYALSCFRVKYPESDAALSEAAVRALAEGALTK